MPEMSPLTTNDLLRLQVYGSMYLSGIEPANIEAALRDSRLHFRGLEAAIGNLAGAKQYDAAGDIVLVVLNSIGTLAQAIPVAGQVIGAVFGVVTGIIKAVLTKRATDTCDSGSCVPGDPGSDRQWRHRRAIVGLSVPGNAKFYDENDSCRLNHYGGTKKSCKARWGYLVSYMNDGMWWWGREPGHEDLLNGTVIGVMGRVDGGKTKGCHKRYYKRFDTPKHSGIENFRARQDAVTQVLSWMMHKMDYGLLSCLQSMIHNNEGEGRDYLVCKDNPDWCNEGSIAHLMKAPGDEHNFGSTSWPYNRKLTSRVYASIRGQFQGLVAMAKKLGVEKSQEILRKARASEAAINVLPRVMKSDIGAWPEQPLAQEMSWKDLRKTLTLMAMEVEATIVAETTAAAAAGGQSYAHIFDNIMSERYSVHPRTLPPIGRIGLFGLPWWTTYVGAGALVVTAGGIIYAASRKDD